MITAFPFTFFHGSASFLRPLTSVFPRMLDHTHGSGNQGKYLVHKSHTRPCKHIISQHAAGDRESQISGEIRPSLPKGDHQKIETRAGSTLKGRFQVNTADTTLHSRRQNISSRKIPIPAMAAPE